MLFTNCDIWQENKLRFLGKEAASNVEVIFLVAQTHTLGTDALERSWGCPIWW